MKQKKIITSTFEVLAAIGLVIGVPILVIAAYLYLITFLNFQDFQNLETFLYFSLLIIVVLMFLYSKFLHTFRRNFPLDSSSLRMVIDIFNTTFSFLIFFYLLFSISVNAQNNGSNEVIESNPIKELIDSSSLYFTFFISIFALSTIILSGYEFFTNLENKKNESIKKQKNIYYKSYYIKKSNNLFNYQNKKINDLEKRLNILEYKNGDLQNIINTYSKNHRNKEITLLAFIKNIFKL